MMIMPTDRRSSGGIEGIRTSELGGVFLFTQVDVGRDVDDCLTTGPYPILLSGGHGSIHEGW